MTDVRIAPIEVRRKQYPWEVASWVDAAASEPNRIDVALGELGIDRSGATSDLQDRLGQLVRRYPEDLAPFGHHKPARPEVRASVIQEIKWWIAGLKVEEEEESIVSREVQLFAFNCPNVKKAKTSYAETSSKGATAGWTIEVFGSGFGSDATVSVTHSSEFTASPGERKLVFAPLRVRLVRAALYKRGKLQERFLKSELAESETREANGIRSVDKSEWKSIVGEGPVEDRFDLARDKGANVAKYSRSYELTGTIETKLGLKAFNLESSVTVKATASRKAEMTFELPPGRTYELRRALPISGFHF
jgi:hypothetical protein